MAMLCDEVFLTTTKLGEIIARANTPLYVNFLTLPVTLPNIGSNCKLYRPNPITLVQTKTSYG